MTCTHSRCQTSNKRDDEGRPAHARACVVRAFDGDSAPVTATLCEPCRGVVRDGRALVDDVAAPERPNLSAFASMVWDANRVGG